MTRERIYSLSHKNSNMEYKFYMTENMKYETLHEIISDINLVLV